MTDYIALFFACVFTLTGFCTLALAQERHWQAVTSLDVSKRIKKIFLLSAGMTAILMALPLSIYAQGPGFGSLLWVVLLTVMASAVTFSLSWRPSLLLLLTTLFLRR